ncbi:PhzF family phenazine biosynthesis protein [Oscillospiraceae bacterium OttesenSCG-928-G22]|nr:PhzF family phenazine biosynthesis protein [Oscillospiraceae bacterium OttesenSCG-928-G22]
MRYFVADAFTDELFSGNPAGVLLLDRELPDDMLLRIAAENNLSETAFVKKNGGGYDLRWFTPKAEVDLCGHATLGAAFIITQFVDMTATSIHFDTKSGRLTVKKAGDLLEMDFPSRKPEPVEVTPEMEAAIGARIREAHATRDLLFLLDSEDDVAELRPDFEKIAALSGYLGVAVTAEGRDVDFVSRFFAPAVGIDEDPVTGSAHATLLPFWSARLGKTEMTARQISARGGTLYLRDEGERVKISGRAALYLKGEIFV